MLAAALWSLRCLLRRLRCGLITIAILHEILDLLEGQLVALLLLLHHLVRLLVVLITGLHVGLCLVSTISAVESNRLSVAINFLRLLPRLKIRLVVISTFVNLN